VPTEGLYIRSCQSDPMCNAKFSRLSSELEDAKMQIQYLEDILKMNDIEDDGSSNDADFLELEQDGGFMVNKAEPNSPKADYSIIHN